MVQQKPWLKFYEPHVPPHIDYPPTTLPAVLKDKATRYPGQTALIFKGTRVTYRQLDQTVDLLAAALQRMGVLPGDRVAILLPNCPQFVMAYYAILRAGAVVVPCNPIYTARELRYQLTDAGAKVLIALSSCMVIVRGIRDQTDLEHIIVTRIKRYFPPLLRLLFSVLREQSGGHRVDISSDPDTVWFGDLLTGAQATPQPVTVGDDETAVLMYTGGTTGLSKGAQLTHRNILVNAYQGMIWSNAQETEGAVLATLPLFHSYGMTLCMNSAILAAAPMILVPDPRDIDDIIKTIHRYRPTLYPGVPAMYVAINNYRALDRYDLSSIEACTSGAAPLPVEVQERFQQITGGRLVEGYGLSEASPVTHGNPTFGDCRIGTVGIPWPDTEATIVDLETGRIPLPVGAEGELCVRGPQVMRGYWRMPTETANVLRDHGDGGRPWLHTGDIATMDDDGYFRIVDRKKEMILGAGGFNVYPREIEEVLYEHPRVMEAAAIGVPAGDRGERIKAFVVPKPGATVTEGELIDFCRQNLAPYKVPSAVEFRDQLPKTLVGKVLRRALRDEQVGRLTDADQ
jgi:long-chain acyl-CoA synthetase